MNRLYRVLLVVFVVFSAVLVYLVVRANRARLEAVDFEVPADSIVSYERRADSLDRAIEVLEMDYASAELKDRPGALLRLDRLRRTVASFRLAIDKWRSARDKFGQDQAYRECILLYGKATGICEVLQPEPPREE